MSDESLKLQRLTDVGCVNLRADASNPDVLEKVARVTGIKVPVEPNTVASGETDMYWLGPDEWLLVGAQNQTAELAAALHNELAAQHAAVNDLSGGYVVYRLSGSKARALLSKGCTLDLHPSVFAPGACAQTGLAKAGVLLRPIQDGAGFDVLVRRSFSDYLWHWMLRAGDEYRIVLA